MIKRIVIAGSRDYNNYAEAKQYIEMCISQIKNEYTLIFVSGCCRGADMLGEQYAEENGYQIEKYPAKWHKYGKAAGPKRNMEMAQICDYAICFWDGKSKGTESMIEFAKRAGKAVRVKRIVP